MNTISSRIPVIDLFAGPGGLGEGFSSLNDGNSFQIVVSAEKDPIAHQTLRLRAFYRLLSNYRPEKLDDYYRFCNGETVSPFSSDTEDLWLQAGKEALCIEIGSVDGNILLDTSITEAIGENDEKRPLVLIGGPPCQAYSIAGRARNKGVVDYKPEKDERHFLYREYLRTIQRNRPDIFVMENVKGILSSKINGDFIFHQILRDLVNPNIALGEPDNGLRYHIVSLVSDEVFKDGDNPCLVDASKFIIRAEEYGIPQARHRVILLGIKSQHFRTDLPKLTKESPIAVKDVIGNMPQLRSKLSKEADSSDAWERSVREGLKQLADDAINGPKLLLEKLVDELRRTANCLQNADIGGLRFRKERREDSIKNSYLERWYVDKNINVWLNHETRGHRIDDLVRYGFAACFAKVHKRSPKGHKEFCLSSLAPAHKNWESGHFSDRFRVQMADAPATTITSHISKDGHYFIHYDATQCRSLTVREAARLQTFPDNYFFQGGRTQQYHQVGNAVPPLLANKIARIVLDILALTRN